MVKRSKIAKIERLDDFDDEYVYDIGIKGDTPYFFGNNILVHNSVYFSATPLFEKEKLNPIREEVIELYDAIAAEVNVSFPPFMKSAFNCPIEMGSIIQGERELIASTGYFIKKKRYGLMVYDNEGKREDVDGKPGKAKVMGLEIKRSDTPTYMQEFLMEILSDLLVDKTEDEICTKIRDFKTEFKERCPWEKGTPKRVNNLTKYRKLYEEKRPGVTIPGHVRASINWNTLRAFHRDNYSMEIQDGMKIIVCKLKDNQLGYTSIGFPIDEHNLPDWFKELPFDDDAMMQSIVNKKVENLFGVMGWDLETKTNVRSRFNKIFNKNT